VLDDAGQEMQQVRALAGIEIAGMARAERNQAGRHAVADLEADQRIGADEAGAGREDFGIADRIVAQERGARLRPSTRSTVPAGNS
jgi:hypothetical protein